MNSINNTSIITMINPFTQNKLVSLFQYHSKHLNNLCPLLLSFGFTLITSPLIAADFNDAKALELVKVLDERQRNSGDYKATALMKEMEKNKITKSELLEISIVNVPANPEALSLAYAKGFERDVIKEAMGKGFIKAEQKLEIQKLKEENEAPVKLNESLNEKLASLETPKAATKGRDPKLVKRDLAIKAVNRAIEQLNRTVKETE